MNTTYENVDLMGSVEVGRDSFPACFRLYTDPSIEDHGSQEVFIKLKEQWVRVGQWQIGPIPQSELEQAVLHIATWKEHHA